MLYYICAPVIVLAGLSSYNLFNIYCFFSFKAANLTFFFSSKATF